MAFYDMVSLMGVCFEQIFNSSTIAFHFLLFPFAFIFYLLLSCTDCTHQRSFLGMALYPPNVTMSRENRQWLDGTVPIIKENPSFDGGVVDFSQECETDDDARKGRD